MSANLSRMHFHVKPESTPVKGNLAFSKRPAEGHTSQPVTPVTPATTSRMAEAAHDLATLISNFKIRLYLARKKPEHLSEHFQALDGLIEELDAMVHEFVQAAQSTVGSQEPILVDLNELVEQVMYTFEPVADQKAIKLTFIAEPDLWPVWATPIDMNRILTNLVSNALNYTPAEGMVTLTTLQVGNSALLTVRDTGIGISPKALPHIFDRFFRSEEAQETAAGTGLGLSIVLGLVEKYAGRIEVESTLGKGSVFKIAFPGYRV